MANRYSKRKPDNKSSGRRGADNSRYGDNYDRLESKDSSVRSNNNFEDVSSFSTPRAYKNRTDVPMNAAKPKKKKSKLKIFLIVFLVLVVGIFCYGQYLLGGVSRKEISTSSEVLGISPEVVSDDKITNIALFGLDGRSDSFEGRSDAIMIISVDRKHNKIKMTSILRDSNVYIEGYGNDKITHAYAYGGPELAVRAINENFKLDITDYVTVNFMRMAKIVDAFGGAKVEITDDEMNEINSNLRMTASQNANSGVTEADYLYQSGNVLLNGNQAVAYSRIRYIGNDDARAGRQQKVMSGLITRVKEISKLEYPNLIREVSSESETSLSFTDVLGLSPIMLTGFEIETLSIPGEKESARGGYTDNGGWVYLYDLEAAANHIHSFIYED